MRRNSKALAIVIIGVVGVGGFGLSGSSATQPPAPQPVVVTNGAASPVPVAGTVNVGNLPATQPVSGTVNVGNLPATQPVSGTVGISGTPTVNVANLPATQPVSGTVGISGVPTVSVQERQPFHAFTTLSTANSFVGTVDIPAGERLVIQSLSVSSDNATLTQCSPISFLDRDSDLYYLPLDNINSECFAAQSGDELFWSQQSQFVISDSGSTSSGDPVFRLTLSGYLVPAS